jgi:hypothetical protein
MLSLMSLLQGVETTPKGHLRMESCCALAWMLRWQAAAPSAPPPPPPSGRSSRMVSDS